MNSLPQSPRKSAKLAATLGIGLLLSLQLLAAPAEQSPVNISRSSTVRHPNPPQIDFNYGVVDVKLTNTYGRKDETSAGRVLAQEWGTLKVIPGSGPEVRLNGVAYDLLQIHFHMPSEHTVNGIHTAMEMHVVHLIHKSPGGPAASCASSSRPLLVLGVFIDAGNSDAELQRLFPLVLPPGGMTPTPPLSVDVHNVDLRALVPAGGPTWSYDGGLTAPANDCSEFLPLSTQAVMGEFPEAVHWYVYDKKMHLPQNLIDRFSALFPEGNSRPLKLLGDRQIYSLKNANQ